MKKVYLFSQVIIALTCSTVTMAQNNCPGATPPFATPVISGGTCRILVQNMHPNAPLVVLNSLGEDITSTPASTNTSGSGSAFYNCNSSPSVVASLGPAGTCFANIAPAIILPIKLQSYSAILQANNTVQLKWTSSFESNSYHYIVQKSTDGRNYSAIGQLDANGNSLYTINYSFEDKQTLEGAAFYRLQMVDIDGSFSYSKVVYANNHKGTATALSVFPNPFRSDLQLIGISAGDVNRKNIRVYSIAGKEINYNVTGANAITIDAHAPAGIYILKVKDLSYKLVKE